MGKNIGLIKLKGKIGDLTFYKSKGTNLVRIANDIDKDRIMKDPAYKRTRENMAEFGGSATIGKSFRLGFGMFARRFGDGSLVPQVVKLMRSVIEKGSGARGKREFRVVANKDEFEGFEFNKSDKLSNFFSAPYTLSVNADRNEVTFTVPPFNSDIWVIAPEGATHFNLLCVVAVLSDFIPSGTKNKYEPVAPDQNELSAYAMSNEILVGSSTTADTVLTCTLPGSPVLSAEAGLLVAIGIEFYQEINGDMYIMASDNALCLERVF